MAADQDIQTWAKTQAAHVRTLAQKNGKTTRDAFLSVQMPLHFEGLRMFPGEPAPAKLVEFELFA